MKSSLLSLFFLFFVQVSFAGGFKVGDGGVGVRCQGMVPLFYDRWEALVGFSKLYSDYDIKYRVSYCEVNDIECYKSILIKIIDDNFSGYLSPLILLEIKSLITNLSVVVLDRNVDLVNLDQDLDTLAKLPHNCEIVQVGSYDFRNHTSFLRPYFYKMSKVDQALLILHEAMHGYFHFASTEFYTSDSVRQFIWFLLANDAYKELNKDAFTFLLERKKPIRYLNKLFFDL